MDTVFFGQQIDGAAAFNHDLLYEQGLITARDTLAAAIPWIFDPVPDIMHSPSADVEGFVVVAAVEDHHKGVDLVTLGELIRHAVALGDGDVA
ncbi:hypothetical protein PF006_g12241 [Phytophthora fragariae]|uniref:Uncharacterized protein n=1 Tax=Phytophthora fragariae TaxID=53985 RepID=A0A6A3TWI2_9STRA|nr:hypothetical protein PF006_g12241 [Phytophthora fragariae]